MSARFRQYHTAVRSLRTRDVTSQSRDLQSHVQVGAIFMTIKASLSSMFEIENINVNSEKSFEYIDFCTF